MAEVVQLPPHSNFTVEEALEYAKRYGLAEVLIGGYTESGSFVTFSSHMGRRDAAWLALNLLDHARGKLGD